MEAGKMNDTKDHQVEGRWVPTTPMKPILQQTPIYSPGQENQPQIPTNGDRAVACSKFTDFMEKNKMYCIGSASEARMKNIVDENSETCVEIVSGDTPAYDHLSFSQLMFIQDNAANLNATQSVNPFFSSLDSQMEYNRIVNNTGDTQGTSFISCSQIESVPINMEKNNSVVVELNKTPQSKQRRRKHRPKVIVESKPKQTPKPTNKKNVQPKENSTGKRKYVRRTEGKNASVIPVEETTSKRSCRRTLFDETSNKECTPSAEKTTSLTQQINPLEAQPIEKTKRGRRQKTPKSYPTETTVAFSEPLILGPKTRSRSKSREESSTGGENSNACINQRSGMMNIVCSHDTSTQQGLKDFHISLPVDTQVQNTSSKDNFIDTEPKENQTKRRRYNRRNATNKVSYSHMLSNEDTKVSSIFSPESTSNETKFTVNCNFEDNKNKRDCQTITTRNEEDATIFSLAQLFSNDPVSHMIGLKREYSASSTSGMNNIGVHYNNLSLYQTKYCPNIQKKNKSEIDSTSNFAISAATNLKEVEISFYQQQYARRLPYASSSNSLIVNSEYEFNMLRGSEGSTSQVDNCFCPTRIQSGYEDSATKMCESLSKKKQNKKKSTLGDYQQLLSLDKSIDISEAVDAIAQQFRKLNIKTQENALVRYKQKKQKQKRLSLGDGTIIPFGGQFVPIQKQHPRPRVDLDEETSRVWKLLMLDINSHGVDGTNKDKSKWWEEERNVFRGRADSFIAKMHLVQGDRRFSRWKGSVVDSVVGVFLTQNVSDHLSSSAFMALAAKFPLEATSTCRNSTEGTSLVAVAPQLTVEPEQSTERDAKMNQSVHDQRPITIATNEHSGVKEAGSYKSTSCVSTSSKGTHWRLPEAQREHAAKEDQACYRSVRTELSDKVSSQSSVSGYLANEQNHEKMGSGADSNSEVEDVPSTATNITSLSMRHRRSNSTRFQEADSQKSSEKPTDARSMDLKNSTPTEDDTQVPLKASIFPSQSLKSLLSNDKCSPCYQGTDPKNQADMSHCENTEAPEKERQSDAGAHKNEARNETHGISSSKADSKGKGKEKEEEINWDSLRMEAQARAGKREKTENTMDSLDWDAVRCADVGDISDAIKERGMNNRLAERIQSFLNRLVVDHGGIDLEWLRDVPPDKAKEFLLSIRGLGLKSVECVRLLTLHHLAFPVDTNVGRIAVRLGWVPLQPLPESLQLHLLELYPILESIQKYLWPRLCKLDQKTLYELHYQMITFGKVFCTKNRPNCNACPMKGECRHFASAFASARLALPAPEQKGIVSTSGSTSGNNATDQNPTVSTSQLHLPLLENPNQGAEILQAEVAKQLESMSEKNICHPIIEEPTTPEAECSQVPINDIEDAFWVDSGEIPTIDLDIEEFTLNLQNYMHGKMELQEGEMSKALVALTPQAANIPMPKLKNVSRLRTEHCVYELPDTHPLLEGWDMREIDDPGKYLLAIWTPGETANSIQPPESKCSYQESGQLCNEKECLSCNSVRESDSQTVRGTLLIPCRTAMRGSFPLNGTYFQVNEVFADHESSMNPISVPRSWIWNLTRRTVYFGTSVTSIFRGLTTQEIQQCFWRGYVCVRGFERAARAPRPLMARLHFPASKMPKATGTTRKRSTAAKSGRAKSGGAKTKPEQAEVVSGSQNLQKGVKPKENPSL